MGESARMDTGRWPERYACLESRMFDTLLLPTPEQPAPPQGSPVPPGAWEALCRWTQRMFYTFREEPSRIMKKLHEDDAHPPLYCPAYYGKPHLKRDMRKSLQAVCALLRLLWNAASACAPQAGVLLMEGGLCPTKNQAALLADTGLAYAGGRLGAGSYEGMFDALHELTKWPDGFERFARCRYDGAHAELTDLFRCFSGSPAAFGRLEAWLRENGFHYRAVLDSSEVQDLEACLVAYTKNIDGQQTPGGFYDRVHIGFSAEFNALYSFPVWYGLAIQRPKEILADFAAAPSAVQQFIITYHAKCTGCGYCIQRFKGKNAKIAAMTVEYGGRPYQLCATLNYTYGYRWLEIDDALADGLIAYLGYMDKKFHAQ